VHKVACNHLLTTDMKLQAMQTSETAWCWFAYDYSDEEPRMDKFAVRFKVGYLPSIYVCEECLYHNHRCVN
jgi:RanBP1 domain